MEPLLQCHVVTPEISDTQVDELTEIIHDTGFRMPIDGKLLAYQRGNDSRWDWPTTLFEDRPDNRKVVDELISNVRGYFENSTVFVHHQDMEFHGERSAKDPDKHIIISVLNTGIDEPSVRWHLEKESLLAPPRRDGDRVYHASKDSIYAIEPNQGEILWETEFETIDRVPEVDQGLIVGSGYWSVRAFDAETGEERWSVEFESGEGDHIQDSRAEFGDEAVFIGNRSGELRSIDRLDGSVEVIAEFDDSIISINHIEDGLLVKSMTGNLHKIGSDGSTQWVLEDAIGIGCIGQNLAYGSAGNEIQAIALEDGSTAWEAKLTAEREDTRTKSLGTGDTAENDNTGERVETTTDDNSISFREVEVQPSGPLNLVDGKLLVPTRAGIFALDHNSGEIVWSFTPADNRYLTAPKYVSTTELSDGRFVAFDADNTLHFMELERGEEFATYSLGGDAWSPVYVAGKLVCVSGPEFVCLEDLPEKPESHH